MNRPLALMVVGLAFALGTVGVGSQSAGLRIVIVEGEDAVNIVQQKTAVAPVVEVRDRNDQPVAGAVVTFAIRNGRATFNGARTLTLTTNAAGRAAAAGLTPTGSGAIQISASAAFQGQTAAVTIAQTNVMTAAQAANASAAGAGGGGGGGIGAGTIAGIAGGAVGGVVGYQQYRKYVEGEPPAFEGAAHVDPPTGIQGATTFFFSTGSMTWHGPDENDDATLTWEFGDGASQTQPATPNPVTGFTTFTHVYGSTGTFTARVRLADHWDRSASQEAQVTVVSLTAQWTSSAGGGVYALSQAGSGISGTFTAPSGAVSSFSGSVSPRAFTTTPAFQDPGRVTLVLPTLVGSTVVAATFTGAPLFNGATLDVNRLVGSLVGPGINNPNVTLTRQ